MSIKRMNIYKLMLDNYQMRVKSYKRILVNSLLLALIAICLFVYPILAAVPPDMTTLTADPSDTSIELLWNTALTATKTMVRVSTTAFPTSATGVDGSLEVYYGTAYHFKDIGAWIVPAATSLTSGDTYYYSAWGWNADGYSANPVNRAATTLGAPVVETTIVTPVLPSNFNQKPASSGWFTNLQPFSGMVSLFATDWGMPRDNMMMLSASIFMVFLSVMVYWRSKNFFLSYGVLFILDVGAVGLHLMFWWSIAILLAFGLGVWAVEKSFQ